MVLSPSSFFRCMWCYRHVWLHCGVFAMMICEARCGVFAGIVSMCMWCFATTRIIFCDVSGALAVWPVAGIEVGLYASTWRYLGTQA
jgi:hypothetical protein